jgi:putative restriction endonuclease
VDYIRNLEALHNFGQSPQDAVALGIVSQNPQVNDAELEISSRVRRKTVASVRRALRDIGFRRRVLTSYGRRCAMCGLQLRLVDAAHIIPVSHENSTDETRNGLALCALHHRAYDQALVTVIDDYSLVLNDKQIREMRKAREAGGLEGFTGNLRPLVLLPPAVGDRPHVEYIRIANRSRGWNQ